MNGRSIVPQALRALPWRLLFLVVGLATFGAIVLYSSAGGSMSPWATSHVVRFAVLMTMALALSLVSEERWKQAALPLYIGVLALLVFVSAVGTIAGGIRAWVDLGFMRLQPSELMKPAIVLICAWFYDRLPASALRSWSALWPPAVLIGIPTVLVILQPDLGTAIMIVAGGLSVMFLAGVPLRLFVAGAVAIAAALPVAYAMMHEYQQNRVLIFLSPERDPLGTGYHITQSKIAIGSGGLTGKGFLNGTQSHLDYLPEGHTDFVFATMAEEWGLIGGLALIVAFVMMVRWGINVGIRAQTRFARLVAAGLSMTIFFYFAINLMMVMGLAPVVGIPLPLLSHGGSAMMTVMICLGIMMSIDRGSRRPSGFG